MARLWSALALAGGAAALLAPAPAARSATVVYQAERSAAMPFLPRPQKLEGMVGDKGFDPLGLSDWVPVDWLRERVAARKQMATPPPSQTSEVAATRARGRPSTRVEDPPSKMPTAPAP